MRYIIIDTQAESANDCYLLGEVLANPGLEQFAHFLSEEETLSKFKEVFEAGYERGQWTWDEFYKGDTVNFNELSKTL